MTAVSHRLHVPAQPTARPGRPTVAIVGLGYVGLPTAISLASAEGGRVLGLEISAERVDRILAGALDHTPEQQQRLEATLAKRRLLLTQDPADLAAADAVVICVPTPIDAHQVPDMSMLEAACATVVSHARAGQTLVLTSTTYAGCTEDLLVVPLMRRGLVIGEDVFVAFSPERINPGAVAHTPETTPRVIGGVTPECAERARRVLAPSCAGFHTVSSPTAAEMTKLLENTFRAVNIAMINEFADNARELGISASEVIEAAATKPYGFMRFEPGPGVGGHCIPCDPHYLLWQMRSRRKFSPVIEASMAGIAQRPLQVVDRARGELAERGRSLRGSRVHVWGVAYKPGVADARESPALVILEELHRLGAEVSYVDSRIPSVRLDGRVLESAPGTDLAQVDLVLVVTVHPEDDLSVLAGLPVLDTTTVVPDGVGLVRL